MSDATTYHPIVGHTMHNGVDPDERDYALVIERMWEYEKIAGPRVGDFVRFACGTVRRFSHHWGAEHGIQTSAGGSYYLGNGYVSMSGGLEPCIPLDTLTDTGEVTMGHVWIFHHDWHRAHNGVGFEVPFRTFTCSLEAN